MQKITLSLLLCFLLGNVHAQANKKTSAILFTQYTWTLKDQTSTDNPWAIGLGLNVFFNSHSIVRPAVEVTRDIYLESSKVGYLDIGTNTQLEDVRGTVNVLAGIAVVPAKNIYGSLTAGPSFMNGQTLLAIKPSFGFYFSSKQRWSGKISYINVFNRGTVVKENFTSVSFALGVRLF